MNPAVAKMLEKYPYTSPEDRIRSLREIMQEIVLVGLWRTHFFDHAAFYGDTALRVLYGLDRFSEDLDFTLLKPSETFSWAPFEKAMVTELEAYGFEVSFAQKMKRVANPVKSAFLKANTLQELIRIGVGRHQIPGLHPDTSLKIKVEIDTAPTVPYNVEQHYLKAPLSATISAVKLTDIFAAKMHCALFRAWKNRVKGRDWYDVIWCIQRDVPFSLGLFSQHLGQECQSREEFLQLANTRIDQLDIASAIDDMKVFIPDQQILSQWSPDFFKYWFSRIRFEV